MLDELLGRAELKERVAELEAERERLEARLEAESERRSDAVTARQRADEEVNRLEDRVADLEGRLATARADDAAPDLSYRGTGRLRGGRLRTVLDRLRSVDAGREGALTAAVDDGRLPDAVDEAFGDRSRLVARAAPCVAVTDDAGLVSATLAPPLQPDPFLAWDDGFRLDESWFRPTGAYALALVRSDTFAYGAFEGEERVAFERVETDVMNAHSKGGFSQARFERLREEQIDAHLDRCREVLAGRAADGPLYVVGERTVLDEFRDLADATRRVDASGSPEAALADAVREFWTTRLSLV
jgi:hypothetical protein